MASYVLHVCKESDWKDISESISVAARADGERKEWTVGLQSCLFPRKYVQELHKCGSGGGSAVAKSCLTLFRPRGL